MLGQSHLPVIFFIILFLCLLLLCLHQQPLGVLDNFLQDFLPNSHTHVPHMPILTQRDSPIVNCTPSPAPTTPEPPEPVLQEIQTDLRLSVGAGPQRYHYPQVQVPQLPAQILEDPGFNFWFDRYTHGYMQVPVFLEFSTFLIISRVVYIN